MCGKIYCGIKHQCRQAAFHGAKQVKERTHSIVAAVFLILISFQVISSIGYHSATVEEGVHLAAGVSYLKRLDFSAFSGYPPAGRMMLGIWPALAGASAPDDPEVYREMYPFSYGSRFLYELNDADRILFKARMTVALLSALLGFFVFRLTSKLAGATCGLIALFFYTFCPNILAHSGLATLDLPLSAFFFIALYFYRQSVFHGTKWNWILAAFFVFLTVDTKFSGLLIFPVLLGWHGVIYFFPPGNAKFPVASKPGKKPKPATKLRDRGALIPLLVMVAFTIFLINVQYGFKGSFISIKSYDEWNRSTRGMPTSGMMKTLAAIPLLSRTPVPLPVSYIQGLDRTVFADRDEQHPNWYMGAFYPKGERFLGYFPSAMALKTPIPFLFLILLWVGALGYLIKKAPDRIEPHLFLLIPCAVFFLFYGIICKSQLGLRLILPIFPFLFCAAGLFLASMESFGAPFFKKYSKFIMAAVGVLCFWQLIASARIFPHYLSYFNELAGGPERGIAYFADSNLDWGQDLKGLKKYMDEKGLDRIHLVYYGPNGKPELDYYGIRPADPADDPEVPWAISATWRYYADLEPFKSNIPFDFKNRPPDHRIGYSIFIYDKFN